jgi:hypothetical protein
MATGQEETVMPKVSINDLLRAEDWLRGYEPAPEEDGSDMLRVADWIRTEILKREDAAYVRDLAKQVGQPVRKVRAALRRRDVAHESV